MLVRTQQYIDSLVRLGYAFRLNMATATVECNGEQMTDGIAAQIRVKMRDAGFTQMAAVDDVVWAMAQDNYYHPVKDYLLGLKYDGGGHIANIASCFTETYGVFGTWLRKWAIGAVAKVMRGEQNPMLVMDGNQGIGKSQFVRWLASGLLDYYIEMPINPDDKDCYLRLASKFVWEVPELGSTVRRSDRESLKHFLSMQEVTVRRAYGKYDLSMPAMASFVGTVNNEAGILADPTGSRRFLCTHIERIDWSYKATDVNLLWAEAVQAYLDGEPWTLSDAERERSEAINAEYQVDDPVEVALTEKYDVDPNDGEAWVSTYDLLYSLWGDRGIDRVNQMQLATTLKKLGAKKVKRGPENSRRWGYTGLRRRQPTTTEDVYIP